MTSLVTSSGTITLPDDMLWPDEFKWSPVFLARSISLGGAMIVEMGKQLTGRPITLIGVKPDGPWIDTATMDALQAAEIAQGDTPMTLTLTDGRTFTVLFLTENNVPAAEGEQVLLRATNDLTERDTLVWIPTLRFLQVG